MIIAVYLNLKTMNLKHFCSLIDTFTKSMHCILASLNVDRTKHFAGMAPKPMEMYWMQWSDVINSILINLIMSSYISETETNTHLCYM